MNKIALGSFSALVGLTMMNVFPSVALSQVSNRSDVVSSFTSNNGGQWGQWTNRPVFCPPGSYAAGYTMRVEPPQGAGNNDDTALNAIRLYCYNRNGKPTGNLEPHPGFWGTWVEGRYCQGAGNFLAAFDLQVEPSLGSGLGSRDDTAANSILFGCSSGGVIAAEGGRWGSFSGNWVQGVPGSAICGLDVKVEPRQGNGDDTALNDVRVYWCRL